MTLKEALEKLNSFDIEKYGDCHIYRPYSYWDTCEISTITIESKIDNFGNKKDVIFIDINDKT